MSERSEAYVTNISKNEFCKYIDYRYRKQFAKIYQNLPKFIKICQNLSKFAKICQICQNLSKLPIFVKSTQICQKKDMFQVNSVSLLYLSIYLCGTQSFSHICTQPLYRPGCARPFGLASLGKFAITIKILLLSIIFFQKNKVLKKKRLMGGGTIFKIFCKKIRYFFIKFFNFLKNFW